MSDDETGSSEAVDDAVLRGFIAHHISHVIIPSKLLRNGQQQVGISKSLRSVGQDNQSSVILSVACPIGPGHWCSDDSWHCPANGGQGRAKQKDKTGSDERERTEPGHELVRWGRQGAEAAEREVRLKLGLAWSELNSDGVQAFRNG